MKKKAVILVLILLPVFLSAQVKFLPVIDSTATCSYFDFNYGFSENPSKAKQVLEVYYVVEKMPLAKISDNKMAEILKSEVNFDGERKTFNEVIFLQCVVNCKGKAGDFQLTLCPDEMQNIGNQVLKVFGQKFTEWEPGIQQGKAVDVLNGITVSVVQGNFSINYNKSEYY